MLISPSAPLINRRALSGRDELNVSNYGMHPNNTGAANLQAFVDICVLAKADGINVWVSPGEYVIDALTNDYEAQMPLVEGFALLGTKGRSILKVNPESVVPDPSYHGFVRYGSNTLIDGIVFDGSRDTISRVGWGTDPHAMYMVNCNSGVVVSNVDIMNVELRGQFDINGAEGFAFSSGRHDIRLRNIWGHHNDGSAVSFDGLFGTGNLAHDLFLDGAILHDNGWQGITVYGAEDVWISNVVAYSNAMAGLNLEFGRRITYTNCEAYGNLMRGVSIFGVAEDCEFNNCRLHGNAIGGEYMLSEVYVGSASWWSAPSDYYNPQSVRFSGGFIKPALGKKHFYIRTQVSSSTYNMLTPSAPLGGITVDMEGCEKFLFDTNYTEDYDSGSPVFAPGVRLQSRSITKLPYEHPSDWLSENLTITSYVGTDNQSPRAVTLTSNLPVPGPGTIEKLTNILPIGKFDYFTEGVANGWMANNEYVVLEEEAVIRYAGPRAQKVTTSAQWAGIMSSWTNRFAVTAGKTYTVTMMLHGNDGLSKILPKVAAGDVDYEHPDPWSSNVPDDWTEYTWDFVATEDCDDCRVLALGVDASQIFYIDSTTVEEHNTILENSDALGRVMAKLQSGRRYLVRYRIKVGDAGWGLAVLGDDSTIINVLKMPFDTADFDQWIEGDMLIPQIPVDGADYWLQIVSAVTGREMVVDWIEVYAIDTGIAGSGILYMGDSPVGLYTPEYRGQEYLNTATGDVWRATGYTNTDWKQVTNSP